MEILDKRWKVSLSAVFSYILPDKRSVLVLRLFLDPSGHFGPRHLPHRQQLPPVVCDESQTAADNPDILPGSCLLSRLQTLRSAEERGPGKSLELNRLPLPRDALSAQHRLSRLGIHQ